MGQSTSGNLESLQIELDTSKAEVKALQSELAEYKNSWKTLRVSTFSVRELGLVRGHRVMLIPKGKTIGWKGVNKCWRRGVTRATPLRDVA